MAGPDPAHRNVELDRVMRQIALCGTDQNN